MTDRDILIAMFTRQNIEFSEDVYTKNDIIIEDGYRDFFSLSLLFQMMGVLFQ